MTQEDKELLLKDLCTRLPYGVKVLADIDKTFDGDCIGIINKIEPYVGDKFPELKGQYLLYEKGCLTPLVVDEVRPYLRPISSITEEEAKQLNSILPCSMSFSYTTGEELIIYTDSEYDGDHYFGCFVDIEDWLNAHHFDFRNLISKGLALEAPEDMYKAE